MKKIDEIQIFSDNLKIVSEETLIVMISMVSEELLRRKAEGSKE